MNRLCSKGILSAFLVLATFVFFMGSVQAQVFCVSTSAQLQSALNQAAANGEHDIIMVDKGTYYGNFVYDSLEGYDLTIKGGYESEGLDGIGPDPTLTVLDGGGWSNVLYLNIDAEGAEGGDILVSGITLRNGWTPMIGGGGLYAKTHGDVVLEDSIVEDNVSANLIPPGGYGGGVYAEGNSVYLARNLIQNNENLSAGLFGAGGGAYLVAKGYDAVTAKGYGTLENGGGEIELWDNIIIDNVAYSNGGGVCAVATHAINAQRNTIRSNRAFFSPKGGGAFFSAGTPPDYYSGSALVVNNVITENRAEGPLDTIGGGLYVEAGHVDLIHNTVANNEAVIGEGPEPEVLDEPTTPAAKGGGAYIYSWGLDTINVYNNIFWHNDADTGHGEDLYVSGALPINVFNNNLSYIGYFGPLPLDSSNQNNDDPDFNPGFVAEALQDYHLLHTSPCIFAALAAAPQEPVDDRDGLPRPRPVGTNPDIGAYELQTCEPTVADFSATPTEGYNDLKVSFTDLSTGDKITAWDWDFGDGSTHGTVPNPIHTYTDPGLYTVKLTITACDGMGTDTEEDYIDVWDCSVTASFTTDPLPPEGPAPLTIQFTDESTGDVYEWDWDFGDGSSSIEQHPEHTYHNYPGTYTASLMVLGCNDWQGPYTTTIKVDYPEPNFTVVLTPLNTTVPRGGKLKFTAAIENIGLEPDTVRFAMNVRLPNGTIYPTGGFLYVSPPVTLNPGESATGTLQFQVPLNAPLGGYLCYGYVGIPPAQVLDQDNFAFTVTTGGPFFGAAGAKDWAADLLEDF